MNTNLSERVKQLCKAKGIQQKELAAKMGIAAESLSRAINGNPQLSTLSALADALGVSVVDLFNDSKPFLCVIIHDGQTLTTNSPTDIPRAISLLKAIQG